MEESYRPVFLALYVSDMDASVRFYRDTIGIPLHADETDDHFEFSWHQPYFHFALFPSNKNQRSSNVEFGLTVDDVDAAHEKIIAAQAIVEEPPKQKPWGRSSTYRDPDGNILHLTQLRRR
jgi:lactoylglutathione lyase